MINFFLVFLFSVIGCFIFRCLPRISYNKRTSFSSDTWFHLLFAKELRDSKFTPQEYYASSLIKFDMDYPCFFHILLGLFGKKPHIIEPYVGFIIDSLYSFFIALFCYFLFPEDIWLNIALFSMSIFLITPAMLGPGWGPRTLTATPRAFGQFLYFLSIGLLILFMIKGNIIFFILAVISGSGVIMTSKFSIQAYALGNILSSIFLFSVYPLLQFFLSIVLAILVSRGFTLKALKGQYNHLAEYALNIWKGKLDRKNILERNKLSHIFQVFVCLYKKDFKEAARILLSKNSFFYVLLQIPVLILFVWILCFDAKLIVNFKNSTFFAFEVALAVLFILTSLKPFLFIGEAERYIEHAVPFLAVHVSYCYVINNKILPLWLIIAFLVIALIIYIVDSAIHFYLRYTLQKFGDQTTEWFKKSETVKNIACIPMSNPLLFRIPYETDHKVLNMGYFRKNMKPEYNAMAKPFSEEFSRYREEVFSKYKINYLVLDKRYLNEKNCQEVLKIYKTTYEDKYFMVLKCD